MYYLYLTLILVGFQGCSLLSVGGGHNILSKQILRARPGYEGFLTNKTCLKQSLYGCSNWSIKAYDIRSPKVRQTLTKLEFICQVNNRRYKFCIDKPGFCRHSYNAGDKVEEYLPISGYDYLLEAGTVCYNRHRL